jgi:peptidyl-prolyl cis-trans isomerase C
MLDAMKSLLLLAVGALAWGQAAPKPADPVVLTVGSEKITQSQFEAIVDTLPEQQRGIVNSPEGRRQLAEKLAELKVLAQAARARKLDQDAGVKTKLALQADQVLASTMFQNLGDAAPDEALIQAYYDKHKSEYEQVQARHILLRFQGSRVPLRDGEKDLTEQEALAKIKDLRAKIVGGAKFADVAKAESDDTGTGEQGGDLGKVLRGMTVPEFEKAAFEQKVGEIGEPVKTQFGYHLILVEAHDVKSFAEVKPEIESKIKPEQAQKGVEDLVKKTSIVYDEGYFGKPEEQPAAQ